MLLSPRVSKNQSDGDGEPKWRKRGMEGLVETWTRGGRGSGDGGRPRG